MQNKYIRNGLIAGCVLCLLGTALFSYRGISRINALAQRAVEVEHTIREAERTLADLPRNIQIEEIELAMHNVTELGNQIAAIQNAVVGSRDVAFSQEQTERLRNYFTDPLLRSSWFSAQEGTVRWQFDTPYDTTLTTIPVLWSCWTTDGRNLVAIVRGIYNMASGTFEQMHMHVTRYAVNVQQIDISEGGDPYDGIQDASE